MLKILPPVAYNMQADSARSMDQMRIPGILRLDKTSRSSEFRATSRTLAAMQVFHFTKNFIFVTLGYFYQKWAIYIFYRVFFSLTLLELSTLILSY